MNNKKIRQLLMFFIVAIIICLIVSIFYIGNNRDNIVKIGVIIPGDRNEKGFNNSHYMGIYDACEELDLSLVVYDNISENNKEQIIDTINSLHEENVKVVFLCSYGYAFALADEFEKYPDMTFFGLSDFSYTNNYNFFFARLYQARYISGLLAGLKTETNNIGYIAAMDNCEVRRGINAFTLGVKTVNPDATVYVTWTNSWNDPAIERENALKLIDDAGVDVIAYHANTTNIIDVADENQIYSICYNTSIDEKYSDMVLTSTEADWKMVYKFILKDYFYNESSKAKSYWLGIEDDAIVLNNYSSLVTEEEKSIINSEVEKIRNGKDVFSNVIMDNEGNIRCNEGELFSDDYLMLNFDWFVDGVVLYE